MGEHTLATWGRIARFARCARRSRIGQAAGRCRDAAPQEMQGVRMHRRPSGAGGAPAGPAREGWPPTWYSACRCSSSCVRRSTAAWYASLCCCWPSCRGGGMTRGPAWVPVAVCGNLLCSSRQPVLLPVRAQACRQGLPRKRRCPCPRPALPAAPTAPATAAAASPCRRPPRGAPAGWAGR